MKTIFSKLLSLYQNAINFFRPKPIEIANTEEEIIGRITFELSSKKNINVHCEIPDFTKADIVEDETEISDASIAYAEFMNIINRGKLQNRLLTIVKDNSKYFPQQKLFYDNVVFYLAILEAENAKTKKKVSDPVVRPSQVFNNK